MDALCGMTSLCGWPATAAATVVIRDDEAAAELRRGPWTAEEDAVLAGHVAAHGEGRWNELARAAGLRRTGKSCRLRWLNYLRPGVRRGGFTPREQLLILDLHSRWGNRWSKIAAHLPGRTDNEVKNYWRTRVQKHAKQLGCDVGSGRFHDAMRNLWMPRLLERIHADESAAADDVSQHCYYSATAPTQHAPPPPPQSQPVYYNYQHPAAAPVGTCARASSPDASCVTAGSSSSSSSREASPASLQLRSSDPAAMPGTGWPTEQCRNGCSSAASGDMFDESWSELLARANYDDADSGLLTDDFGFGQTADSWWSLDDILQQPLY